MYGHHMKQEYGSTRQGCQSCSWSAEQGKSIFSCARSRLRIWSRQTGSAVPSCVSLPISILSRLNLVLTHGIPPAFHDGVHLFIPSTAIGSVLNSSGHAIAYRWRSLPRARRRGASSRSQGSSSNGCRFFRCIAMDQFFRASLFPHLLLL